MMKLSDYVWDFVASLGIRHVFMFPGGGAMHLVDSLGNNKSLEYVTLLHEQACAIAAETYARIDYNMGAALVTTGPGGTNAVTGVAAAWLESTPMIVVSGQAKTTDLKDGYGVRQRGNQEIGIVDIVSSITKYAITVKDPQEIRYHLERAVYEAKCGRPGPVWIDIPLDVQAAQIEPDELRGFVAPEQVAEDKQALYTAVDQVIQLLLNAKKPLIIAGQGIERGNGKHVFRELVDYLKIPVLTSWIAVELLEYDNPYNFGKPGMVAPRYSNFALQDSDLVIAIGTRLDPAMIGYDPDDFAPHSKKVIVDVDAAELNKFQFAVEKKIVADGTSFITALLAALKERNIHFSVEDWVAQCASWKAQYPVVLDKFRKDEGLVNPYYFMDVLSDCLADDEVIIPGSSGAAIDVYWLCLKNKKDQRTLATGSLGSMGYGIPAAIGACKATGRRTVCIDGDGSLQLNIQEFASIKGMNLPLKVFVNNNGGYLSIMNMQRTHFSGHFVGANCNSHLHIPDIEAVAKAYGFTVYRISSHENMEQIIRRALDTNGPVLCNVLMRDDVAIQPKVMSRVMPDGSIKSGGLRDLWPFLDENP